MTNIYKQIKGNSEERKKNVQKKRRSEGNRGKKKYSKLEGTRMVRRESGDTCIKRLEHTVAHVVLLDDIMYFPSILLDFRHSP